jgi:DNA-binding transcriptional ArsR family regulator
MDSKVLSGLLNPIRMKILLILMSIETATAKRIAEDMPDIPPASLYRHINKLVADDILEICAENKIRGTLEKVYRLKSNPFQEVNERLKNGNKEELYQVFYTFVMTLLSDFRDYLEGGNYDLEKDRVGFRSYPLYMSDGECDEFFKTFKNSLDQLQHNESSEERRLRKFSFVMMPGDQK